MNSRLSQPHDSTAISGLHAAIEAGIDAASESGRPEAVLREYVQPELARILASRGARFESRDEVSLRVPDASQASVLDAPLDTAGRADAIYNRFVIEFEPPGSLRRSVMHSATRHAVSQVQQYLRGISDETGLPLDRLAGCAFDGSIIVYVTWERATGVSSDRPLPTSAPLVPWWIHWNRWRAAGDSMLTIYTRTSAVRAIPLDE